jgi:hypothetical protein
LGQGICTRTGTANRHLFFAFGAKENKENANSDLANAIDGHVHCRKLSNALSGFDSTFKTLDMVLIYSTFSIFGYNI